MATKPTIVNIASGSHYDATDLNSRFNTLADWFETVLGLDGVGGSPNSMTGTLDMDSNRIQNLGAPTASGDAARLQDIEDASDLDSGILNLRTELGSNDNGEGASLIGIEDSAGDYTATDVEGALAEVKAGFDAHDVDTEAHGATGAVVGTTNTQTLTNKTLSNPTFTGLLGTLVYSSVNVSVSNDTTPSENLAFDSESYDTASAHDTVTNNSRITIPSGVTKVRLSAQVTVAFSGTGDRIVGFRKNGTFSGFIGASETRETEPSATLNYISQIQTGIILVSPTDYFEVAVYQNSGGALNALTGSVPGESTWFAMEVVE